VAVEATLNRRSDVRCGVGRASPLLPSRVPPSSHLPPSPLIRNVSTRNDVAKAIAQGRFCCVVVGSDPDLASPRRGLAWGWQPKCKSSSRQTAKAYVRDGVQRHRQLLHKTPTLRIAPTETLPPSTDSLRDSEAGQLFQATANVIASCLLLGCMRAALDLTIGVRQRKGAIRSEDWPASKR